MRLRRGRYPPAVQIRPAVPEEWDAAGRLTLAAYEAIGGAFLDEGYKMELRDAAPRAREALLLVASTEPEDAPKPVGSPLLGCVTYVPDEKNPWAESLLAGDAGIRMLAVAAAAQGRGIGEALVRECVGRARSAGKAAVFLHSSKEMVTAHRLYARLGFVRAPGRDWFPVPDVDLLAFVLVLNP